MQPDPQDDPYLDHLISMLVNGRQAPVPPANVNVIPPTYANLSPGTPQPRQQSPMEGIAGIAGGLQGLVGAFPGSHPQAATAPGTIPAGGMSAPATPAYGGAMMAQAPPGSAEAWGAHPLPEPMPPWHPGPTDWQHSLIGRIFQPSPPPPRGGPNANPDEVLRKRGFDPNGAPYKLEAPSSPPGVTKTSPTGASSIKDQTIQSLADQIMPTSPRAERFQQPDLGIGMSPRAARYEDPTLMFGGGYGGY